VYKGDLSNELPKRVIVVMDVFTNVEPRIKKILRLIPVSDEDISYDRQILSKLYLFADRKGYTLELASFDKNNKELKKEIDLIDEQGTNPFRYFTAYKSVNHLVNELPYRPEVVGVLDLPDRLLRYGHWGMDYSQI
jgi:hypothetical protein